MEVTGSSHFKTWESQEATYAEDEVLCGCPNEECGLASVPLLLQAVNLDQPPIGSGSSN